MKIDERAGEDVKYNYVVKELEEYPLTEKDTRKLIQHYQPELNQELSLPMLVAVFNTRASFQLKKAPFPFISEPLLGLETQPL